VTVGIGGAVSLDELVPQEHAYRAIEAFVGSLDLVQFGFDKAQPTGTGRQAYDPADRLSNFRNGVGYGLIFYVTPV
jgi:hypothetical protein